MPARREHTFRDLTLLGVLVAVVTGLDVWWRTLEARPPHWDMGHHLANSLEYLRGFSVAHPLPFLDAYLYYPPLVYWVSDAFFAVLGNEAMWVAILGNVVWLAMLVFATYGIGKRLWSARVGLLSVAFLIASPMVITPFKEYMLDAPLTAITALGLYLLIRADGFSVRRYSLLFGLTAGCGLLVKWTFPFVLALPVIHASAGALAAARQRRRFDLLVNLTGAGALVVAVAGTWYVHNFGRVAGSLNYYSSHATEGKGGPRVATPAGVLWYLWNLFNEQLYLLPFLFVLAGAVYCFCKRDFARRNAYPLLSVVGIYVMFTLLRHKDPRYTMPILPPLAIVATSWLEYASRRVRLWGATVLVAYAAVAFLAISFGSSLLPKQLEIPLPASSFAPASLTLFGQHGYIIGPPTNEDWHQQDVFTAMSAYPEWRRSFAYRGPDTIWFNKHGLSYYALRYDARWARANRAHFLIERGQLKRGPSGFTQLRRWPLPDGGRLALFARVR